MSVFKKGKAELCIHISLEQWIGFRDKGSVASPPELDLIKPALIDLFYFISLLKVFIYPRPHFTTLKLSRRLKAQLLNFCLHCVCLLWLNTICPYTAPTGLSSLPHDPLWTCSLSVLHARFLLAVSKLYWRILKSLFCILHTHWLCSSPLPSHFLETSLLHIDAHVLL